jgi:hypothetical protein
MRVQGLAKRHVLVVEKSSTRCAGWMRDERRVSRPDNDKDYTLLSGRA